MADIPGTHPLPAFVERPDQLTPGWFAAVLGTTGSPAAIDRVTAEEVGTGQMSVTLRVRLDGHGGRTRTLITKLARPEVASGPIARAAYAKEVAFYTELAPRLPVRTPRCHHAAIADDASAFTLVLDDLIDSRPGDQIEGCPVPAAEAAVINLAALHGPTWCDDEIAGRPWLTDPSLTAEVLAPVLEVAADQFGDRFAGELTVGERAVLDASRRVLAPWMVARAATFSVLHGDYRLDNLLFPLADPGKVAAVDWQTVGIAQPGRDLAYFVGTCLSIEDRRRHEHQLVALYHDHLAAHGVDGYPLDQCVDDYRAGMLHGPLIILLGRFTATTTERGDTMFLTMWRRCSAAIAELGTLDLLPS
ncbi:MAG TPA: phosphotransferase [Acidimicrobiales bacterium]|nr:phosphotransferase [Acidimicrobiales bacterium]